MSRPRSLAVVAVVVATLAFAAPIAAAKTVPVADWTASVCKGFAKWQKQLTKLGSVEPTAADPIADKAAIVKYLKATTRATNTLAKMLKSAGVPEIKGGAGIAAAFKAAVDSVRTAYAAAQTTAAALPTADPATFASGAHALAAQLQAAGATLAETLASMAQDHPASAIVKAFRSTKACRALA